MANEPVAGATGGDSGSAASRTYRSLTAPPVHTPAETEAHATERPGNRSRHSAAVADARPSAGESAQPRRRCAERPKSKHPSTPASHRLA